MYREYHDVCGLPEIVCRCHQMMNKRLYSPITYCITECPMLCDKFVSGNFYNDNLDALDIDRQTFEARYKDLVYLISAFDFASKTFVKRRVRRSLLLNKGRAKKTSSYSARNTVKKLRHKRRVSRANALTMRRTRNKVIYEDLTYLDTFQAKGRGYANFVFRKWIAKTLRPY